VTDSTASSSQPRRIDFVTSARSDFGLMAPLLQAIKDDPEMTCTILVTGMHFDPVHGNTVDEIRAMGFAQEMVELPLKGESRTPGGCAETMADGVSVFARRFQGSRPDILVIPGDRFDVLPAAIAALPFNFPVAHISGGEVTEGAMDDSIRHALTKFSHLHFPAHEIYGRRIEQLGEEPWRITVAGELGLDMLATFPFMDRKALFEDLSLSQEKPLSILTYHPETVTETSSSDGIAAILGAAREADTQIVITYPNDDPGSGDIIQAIEGVAAERDDWRVYLSLGRSRYLNILRHADCMVGNSSSGIIEAASFTLPVVNVGNRQMGRIMGPNILNVPTFKDEIFEAWRQALSPNFRQSLAHMENPYYSGNGVERILDRLKTVALNARLTNKRFQDVNS
jgi:UDP-hydrolysing UDP-N-acetyl-D-glucosamine 2-epimerase